uniref:Uncharacterized protein n=1 Tax=Oryza brachyantha TaxID=4533 RepID=J3MVU0_ORYBR
MMPNSNVYIQVASFHTQFVSQQMVASLDHLELDMCLSFPLIVEIMHLSKIFQISLTKLILLFGFLKKTFDEDICLSKSSSAQTHPSYI